MSTGLRKGGFHFKRKTCRLYSVLRYFEKLFLNVHWFKKNRILIKVHCCSFLMEDTARINSKLQERSKTWHADPIAVGVVVTCCSLDQEWSLALHGVTWWELLRYVLPVWESCTPATPQDVFGSILIHVLVLFQVGCPGKRSLYTTCFQSRG